jgi:hypothetical protein
MEHLRRSPSPSAAALDEKVRLDREMVALLEQNLRDRLIVPTVGRVLLPKSDALQTETQAA